MLQCAGGPENSSSSVGGQPQPLLPPSAGRWCCQLPPRGDATAPASLQPGLINGLPARAEAQREVYETFTSPLLS